ncbi:hypothetical protein BC828DRAFT_399945 [Blastocladiella britannica]|nr:hypothetical protein BC828DRAFT_399945 [Blastocladiella britannica]
MGWVEEWYPSAALTHPVNAYCTQPPPEGLDIRRTWIVETTQYRVAGNPNGIPVLEWMRAKNVLLVPQVLRAAAAYGNIAAIEWWLAQDWGLSEQETIAKVDSIVLAASIEDQQNHPITWLNMLAPEAVMSGRVDILAWGWQRVRAVSNFSDHRFARIALTHGHDGVLDWLRQQPELRVCLQAVHCSDFRIAAMNGNLDGVVWWHAQFGLLADHVRSIISGAMERDHVFILEWWEQAILPLTKDAKGTAYPTVAELLNDDGPSSLDQLMFWQRQFSDFPAHNGDGLVMAWNSIIAATCANSTALLEWWCAFHSSDQQQGYFFEAAPAALERAVGSVDQYVW